MAFENPQRNLTVPTGAGGSSPRIVIGPDVPAILQNPNANTTMVAAILMYLDATHYQFYGILNNTLVGPSIVTGVVQGTEVYVYRSDDFLTGAASSNFGTNFVVSGNVHWHGSSVDMWSDSSEVNFENDGNAGIMLYSDDKVAGVFQALRGIYANRIYGHNPTAGSATPETWHSISALGFLNGWANRAGKSPMGYRAIASPPNTIEVEGEMIAGTVAGGTSIHNALPAAYRPSFPKPLCTLGHDLIIMSTGGQMQYFGTGALGDGVIVHGFYTLDH